MGVPVSDSRGCRLAAAHSAFQRGGVGPFDVVTTHTQARRNVHRRAHQARCAGKRSAFFHHGLQRLHILQNLDTLGAGFQIASHDLDIRGAGNLLGDEQSGHIKEVGFELYQQMLEEAVAEVKGDDEAADGTWSPQITVGTAVMIPEGYVPDLQLRLALYRRLADLETPEEIDGFGAELIDRFGPLPDATENYTTISNGKVYVVQRPGDAGSVYDDAFWEEAHYRFVVTDKLFENGTPL